MKRKPASITKSTFIEELKRQHDLTGTEADKICDTFFNTMYVGLTEGRTVKLMTIGSLIPRVIKTRKGVNPQTGEKIVVAEQTTLRVKQSKILKDGFKENEDFLLKVLK